MPISLVKDISQPCFVCGTKILTGKNLVYVNVTSLEPLKDKKGNYIDAWTYTSPDCIVMCEEHREMFDKKLEEMKVDGTTTEDNEN